jgi:hypothetical protein
MEGVTFPEQMEPEILAEAEGEGTNKFQVEQVAPA